MNIYRDIFLVFVGMLVCLFVCEDFKESCYKEDRQKNTLQILPNLRDDLRSVTPGVTSYYHWIVESYIG